MSGSASDAYETRTKWYFAGCIFPGSCSKLSWKKAKVQSWVSDDDCRQALLRHVMWSTLHDKDRQEHGDDAVRALVDRHQIETEQGRFTKDEVEQWQKPQQPQHPQHPPPGCEAPARKRPRRVDMCEEDKDDTAERAMQKWSAAASCTSNSSSSAAHTQCMQRGIADAIDKDAMVSVTVGELKALQDDVRRCGRAIINCKEFLGKASRAFGEEFPVFAQTVDSIQQIIEKNTIARML